MRTISTWTAVVVAAGAVVAVAVAMAAVWSRLGASEISAAGWLALGGGVAVTLALGFGLMALMFASHKRGYDDRASGDR